MKKAIIFTLFTLMLLPSMLSCGSSSTEGNSCDTVAFELSTVHDSVTFPTSKGGTGVASAFVNVSLPIINGDSTQASRLHHTIVSWALGIDTTNLIDSVAHAYATSLLARFDTQEVYDIEEEMFTSSNDAHPTMQVRMQSSIAPCYNKHSILSMCREVTTRYNNEEPSTEHTYLNILLPSMKRITLDNLFKEDATLALNSMLQKQLYSTAGVNNINEMLELGYFNLDNLTVNNNFTISPEGITWVYLPLEIACFRVGETRITLTYDALAPYFVENNPLNSIANANN